METDAWKPQSHVIALRPVFVYLFRHPAFSTLTFIKRSKGMGYSMLCTCWLYEGKLRAPPTSASQLAYGKRP